MALSSSSMCTLVFFTTLLSFLAVSNQQPFLSSLEQDAVYQVLDSVNPTIHWRSLFPDDLCSSPPHGVVCDYFTISTNDTVSSQTETVHITELSFGYVSDYSPNPPCNANSTLNPLIFTSFKHLRKLFFYKCFTEKQVPVPDNIPASFGSSLEELVFIDNPSFVGPLGGIIGSFTNLRRLVLTGNGVYGGIPDKVGDLVGLEEITLSRNKLSGGFSFSLDKLMKLRILDLSQNQFDGNVPEEMGNLTNLLKLDLSSNVYSGKIPESLGHLKSLEFMDLSFNRFGNFGVPTFLAEMDKLREVYLSGNFLGGEIPEIWESLGGIVGIGLSGTGLVGKIPASMGIHLKKLSYLSLDNNKLQGNVPEEFGVLEFVGEINLENNNLSGRVPFSAKFSTKVGEKLKLKGNPDLCIDEKFSLGKNASGSIGQLKLCKKPDNPKAAMFSDATAASPSGLVVASHMLMFLGFLVFFA
ncbi:ROP-interactive CRIB motif-containing protein 7 [Citrus sinensis]|uniref:piriformospora indica-insensitive protein 2 n=1 Tax=Citrus sinensis TaxID=2711 RepID=UPI00219AEA43|nr:piriformospora indica-insensitive protein 2 [Citrus sinensis]KAH9729239.1 ROP-interactive CRIB motif-containing protein 7 [Citrus sinensis]